jgi:hypothetical protein
MRKAPKVKQSKPSRKPVVWSARKAKILRSYRSAGTASYCSK